MLFSSLRGLPDPAYRAREPGIRKALQHAGLRDHADEEADRGVEPSNRLHADLVAPTPSALPGATTVRTAELVSMLLRTEPLLIDVALDSWGRSIPGAIGLQGTGQGVSFSAGLQNRFERKIRELTGGNLAKPIVAFCANSERFTGYNLALRLVALGYSQVYWYRGGVEAWQATNQPDSELALHKW